MTGNGVLFLCFSFVWVRLVPLVDNSFFWMCGSVGGFLFCRTPTARQPNSPVSVSLIHLAMLGVGVCSQPFRNDSLSHAL